jgi:thiamine-phosphate pyrophosphorylase
MTPSEMARENPRAVLTANFKRAGEALRSLEEYTKLLDPWLAGRFEVLRYDMYTLEKLVITAVAAHRSLQDARLYLLAGGQSTLAELVWVVREALLGGVQVIQLREKGLSDREYLTRAREIRLLAAEHHAHFVVNDRPDLARLAGAHGVHLGQDDMAVRDARRIIGPLGLIGVSTHDSRQIERAILDGAGYLGVGPVFSSTTKSFDDLAGLAHVQAAADVTRCPWFAIGGITLENLSQVIAAGARRVAVGAAVCRAERPRDAARAFRDTLEATEL